MADEALAHSIARAANPSPRKLRSEPVVVLPAHAVAGIGRPPHVRMPTITSAHSFTNTLEQSLVQQVRELSQRPDFEHKLTRVQQSIGVLHAAKQKSTDEAKAQGKKAATLQGQLAKSDKQLVRVDALATVAPEEQRFAPREP